VNEMGSVGAIRPGFFVPYKSAMTALLQQESQKNATADVGCTVIELILVEVALRFGPYHGRMPANRHGVHRTLATCPPLPQSEYLCAQAGRYRPVVGSLGKTAMTEKAQLQQYLASMHKHLSSLEDLCNAAKTCLAHTEEAYSSATTNAKMHGETLSEVERQRYAALIKEAQDNVTVAARARTEFLAKLGQLEERIARL
jgi:hypothetical protein